MSCQEDDEEEIIVYADMDLGAVDHSIFQREDLNFKIIGLDSENPILQLGKSIMRGEWKDCLGTKLIFEENPTPEKMDPVFTNIPPKIYELKCTSRKILKLSRVFLKEKEVRTETVSQNIKSEISEDVVKLADSISKGSVNLDSEVKNIIKGSNR